MQNQLNENEGSQNNSNTSGPQSVNKVMFRLKQLHQIQDESRNELCPVFADEQSNIKSIKSMKESNDSHRNPFTGNILKQLEETEGMNSGGETRIKSVSPQTSYNPHQDTELHLSNIKLKQDNMKLFSECIKLKKKCQVYQSQLNPFGKKQVSNINQDQQSVLKEQIVSLKQKIIELTEINQRLSLNQTEVSQIELECQSLSLRYKQKQVECDQYKKLKENCDVKIQQLEKELQLSQSRTISKSSSQNISINTTTQQSRKSEVDKDRMITNLRIVHENEIRKLKAIIEELRGDKSLEQYGLGTDQGAKTKRRSGF